MALAPDTKFLPGLLILLHLPGWSFAAPADTHCICYNFTVMFKPPPGQRWCEVRGHVDKKIFVLYDCGSRKVITLGPLGMKINATKEWEKQTETLKDVGDELKYLLARIKPENDTTSAPPTLQAEMCCQREAGRHTGASWRFRFNGQMFLLFDSEKKTWTKVHPEARLMQEEWEKDRDLRHVCVLIHSSMNPSWENNGHRNFHPIPPPPMAIATAITLSPWIFLTCLILLGI
uniref:MHC class I-like antigen recognition-like domain-containing protein n=1 Tax=Loxodonta africana TaxID=9785 RepID=G3TR49_LOXAF